MPSSTWSSFFAHVFDAELYQRARYLPAGSWVEIQYLDQLEKDAASYIYGSECTAAYLIQATYKNVDKTWMNNVFLVPSNVPVKSLTGYRAEWADEHELFIVKERLEKKAFVSAVANVSAFEHFNWNYGYVCPEPVATVAKADKVVETVRISEPDQEDSFMEDQQEPESEPVTANLKIWVDSSGEDYDKDFVDESEEHEEAAADFKIWADASGEDYDKDFVSESGDYEEEEEYEGDYEDEEHEEEQESEPEAKDSAVPLEETSPAKNDEDLLNENQLQFKQDLKALLEKSWAEIDEEEYNEVYEEQEGEVEYDGQYQEESELEQLQLTPQQQFEQEEHAFWTMIRNSPPGCANPPPKVSNEYYEAPEGDYRALSFDCYPQYFVSTTTPETTLWATASFNVRHWQHGFSDLDQTSWDNSPFSRNSILAAEACKTLTPVRYDGPGHILTGNVGSKLQQEVTGYAHKSFLPVGRIMTEQADQDDPHEYHYPMSPHWSILTLNAKRTTSPFIIDDSDDGHKLSPVPFGPSRKRVCVGEKSPLRNFELAPADDKDLHQQHQQQNDEQAISSSDEDAGVLSPETPPTPLSPISEEDNDDECLDALDDDIEYFYGADTAQPQSGSVSASAGAAVVEVSSVEDREKKKEDQQRDWSMLGVFAVGAVVGFSLGAWLGRLRR